MRSTAPIFLLAVFATLAAADDPDRLAQLAAAHPDAVELREIGRTFGGRPIRLAVIGRAGEFAPDDRPALLVVAGLEGSAFSTRLALATIEHLAGARGEVADLLTRRTVYVVPDASPDASARRTRGNARPVDEDRDGRADEDPPADLDGDGQVVWIRVPDAKGEWRASDEDPRLLVKADRKKGERGTYALHPEGLDADDDGAVAEDGTAGVDVDRNFPHRHDEASDEAGLFAASEPETRALADFVIGHPNVAASLVFGLDDDLLKAPAAEATPGGATTKIDPDDLPFFERAGELYREIAGVQGAPRETPGGTFFEWAYHHRGLLSLAARGWYPLQPPEGAKEEKPPSDDLRRLRLAEALGRGFVEWHPFDHPTFGKVEIGGFVDGFELEPAEEAAARIATSHAPYAARVLGLLPDVHLADVQVRQLADGLHEVKASLVGDGRLPLSLAQGRRSRRPGPVVLKLEGDYELAGGRPDGYAQSVVWDLGGSGGRIDYVWLVRNARRLAVSLDSRRGFRGRKELELP